MMDNSAHAPGSIGEHSHPLVAKDSPLARLSQASSDVQRGWLEGVRYAIEISDLSYRRLSADLLAISNAPPRADGKPDAQSALHPAAVTDAWTFVDGVARLRRVLRARSVMLFEAAASEDLSRDIDALEAVCTSIQPLRNALQHIDERITDNLVADKLVWGHLTWYVPRVEENRVDIHTLVPGSMPRASMPFDSIDTRGGRYHLPIDRIALTAFGKQVDLTVVHAAVARLVGSLERAMVLFLGDGPREATGLLMTAQLQFGEIRLGDAQGPQEGDGATHADRAANGDADPLTPRCA